MAKIKELNPTNYTVILGNDMRDSIKEVTNLANPFESNHSYVIFNHEAFVFDEKNIFKYGKDAAWNFYEDPMEDVDEIYILLTRGLYEYARYERKAMWFMHKLFNTTMKHQKLHFIKMEVGFEQECADTPKDIVFTKSGFMCKTESDNSIFNAVVFVNKQPYLITLVLKGFVGKSLSQPIIDAFEKRIELFNQEHGRYPDFFGVEPKIRLPWKKYPEPDSLVNVINGNDGGFVEYLVNNTDIQDSFQKLEYQNIIINFRVLSRDLL